LTGISYECYVEVESFGLPLIRNFAMIAGISTQVVNYLPGPEKGTRKVWFTAKPILNSSCVELEELDKIAYRSRCHGNTN